MEVVVGDGRRGEVELLSVSKTRRLCMGSGLTHASIEDLFILGIGESVDTGRVVLPVPENRPVLGTVGLSKVLRLWVQRPIRSHLSVLASCSDSLSYTVSVGPVSAVERKNDDC